MCELCAYVFFFDFSLRMQSPLRVYPPEFLPCFERFGAEIKTEWVHQYWLPGVLHTGPADNETGQDSNDLARN